MLKSSRLDFNNDMSCAQWRSVRSISNKPSRTFFMSSTGLGSTPESGIRAPDAIATAMESINTLSVWLVDAGLDKSAIARVEV